MLVMGFFKYLNPIMKDEKMEASKIHDCLREVNAGRFFGSNLFSAV